MYSCIKREAAQVFVISRLYVERSWDDVVLKFSSSRTIFSETYFI